MPGQLEKKPKKNPKQDPAKNLKNLNGKSAGKTPTTAPGAKDTADIADTKAKRIPVVVVLGHVDHGKTTLLDAIRNTSVQKQEPSGITQNIYISEITYKGQPFTFVDTPGHEVFSLMRVQGGKVADLALLIVAADEGVKPQTLESLEIIKKEGIKFIVVITKIDTPGANTEKVKNELLSYQVFLEGYGGDVPVVEVSAVQRKGIDELLETMLLMIEVEGLLDEDLARLKLEELVEDKQLLENVRGYGIVLDSTIDKALGRSVFAVWKAGVTRTGDYVIVADSLQRMSRVLDADKKPLKQVIPGKAFVFTGLDVLPNSGDTILLVDDAKKVQRYLEKKKKMQAAGMATGADVPNIQNVPKNRHQAEQALAELFEKAQEQDFEVVPLVIKFDVEASLRSIVPTIEKFNTEKVHFKVISAGVGQVTDADIDVARTFGARVLGFRVPVSNKIKEYARAHQIEVTRYDTVYKLYDYLTQIVEQIMEKYKEPEPIGKARALKVFVLSDKSVVAGSRVIDGVVKRKARVHIVRDGERITQEPIQIQDLKVLKDRVDTVEKGRECGINLGQDVQIQEGDVLEVLP